MVQSNILTVGGSRNTGQSVRTQNVTAAISVANIVKSSLGPVGLDKMLVDEIGDVTVTNDGATILKLLDVEHPAAKILVELADLQDQEVGDGTTSVVILASELLRNADELVKAKIHPTTIIAGYRLAMKECVKYIQENLLIKTDKLGRDAIVACAKTSMSSKIISSEIDYFAELVVKAMENVKRTSSSGQVRYPVKAVNVLKAHGGSYRDTQLIDGYALNCTKASQTMPNRIKDAKIACLDINLHKVRMHLGVNIVVDDPEKLEAIRQREIDITKERIQKILATGANVILTTKGIDDLSLKYFVEAGAIGVRRCKMEDLKRIARASGATLVSTLADLEGEETFTESMLGHAAEVAQERISDDELIVLRGMKNHGSSSIILRGPNLYALDEMERSVHDSLCVVKRVLESKALVAGGGAVETALSIYLENFATTLHSREQLAIAEFAKSLLVIPRVLSVNAAKDASDLIAILRAYHNAAQTDSSKVDHRFMGLDLVNGVARNNRDAGVFEPAISKIKSIRFATEAAITILRIDDLIKLTPPEQGEQGMDYQQAVQSGALDG
eukprot:Clim_evm44s108 gene=Clim_evmTU44s108